MERYRIRVEVIAKDGSSEEIMQSENDGFLLLEKHQNSSSQKLWGLTPGDVVDLLMQSGEMPSFCEAAVLLQEVVGRMENPEGLSLESLHFRDIEPNE